MLFQTASPVQGDYFHVMRENRRALELATDAAGRHFELLDLPSPIISERYGSERYCDCYANYILVNGAVISTAFGVEQDQAAREVFAQGVPRRGARGVVADSRFVDRRRQYSIARRSSSPAVTAHWIQTESDRRNLHMSSRKHHRSVGANGIGQLDL